VIRAVGFDLDNTLFDHVGAAATGLASLLQEQQESKLRSMGIDEFFVSVLAIGTLSVPKPNAQAFVELCDALGCPPEEVMYVGDDPHNDAIAATNAGLHGVWLNRESLETPIGVRNQIQTLDSLVTGVTTRILEC